MSRFGTISEVRIIPRLSCWHLHSSQNSQRRLNSIPCQHLPSNRHCHQLPSSLHYLRRHRQRHRRNCPNRSSSHVYPCRHTLLRQYFRGMEVTLGRLRNTIRRLLQPRPPQARWLSSMEGRHSRKRSSLHPFMHNNSKPLSRCSRNSLPTNSLCRSPMVQLKIQW